MNKTKSKQTGFVLGVSLIVLLVATMIVITSMQGATMQERMSSNHNNKSISLMAAEQGANVFWDWLRTENNNNTLNWDDTSWRNSWPLPTSSGNSFWINPVSDIDWYNDRVEVTVNGASLSNEDDVLGLTRIRVVFMRPIQGSPSGVNNAFKVGLLAGGNIQINGNANLTGSAHANANFQVTGGNSSLNNRSGVDENGLPFTNTSSVSAQASASISGRGVDSGAVISGAPSKTIPSAIEHIQANQNNPGVIPSCTIPNGNLNRAVYFCNGNATTSGNFSNGTILVTGNVTHNGASQLGGSGELTVKIVAGGNITVGGSNNTFGVFWADGNIVQNGSSTLGGSIIAGGNITRNGVFNYQQIDDFGDLILPPGDPEDGTELAIQRWNEIY